MQAVGNKRFVAYAFLVSLTMAWGAATAAPQYRLVELPFNGPPDDPFNDTAAMAINRIGDTAVDFYGQYGSSGLHCTRTTCNAVPPLYIPHWPAVSTGGINDAGLMLATSADLAYQTHALIYDGTTSTRIYGFPDDFCGGCNNDSYGHGLNNVGQAVGSAFGNDGRERGFIWQAGVGMQELGTLGGSVSVALAINDHGDVAGYSDIASGATHAFFYRRGRMIDIGTLGGNWAQAMGISDSRHVVGCSTLEGDEQTRAFVYRRGTMTALPSLGGRSACAYGINMDGTIVGAASNAAEETHGFVFDGTQTVDLNDQLSASDRAKWLIIGANAVNHRGMIAATGQNRLNGTVRALLLRPRPAAEQR
jgi:probable HAF family extracellular repeat protein